MLFPSSLLKTSQKIREDAKGDILQDIVVFMQWSSLPFLREEEKRNISYLAAATHLKFALNCYNWGGYKADRIPAETMGKLTIISTGKQQILLHFLFNDSSTNKAFVCKHLFLKQLHNPNTDWWQQDRSCIADTTFGHRKLSIMIPLPLLQIT